MLCKYVHNMHKMVIETRRGFESLELDWVLGTKPRSTANNSKYS